ncbi:uncharacterized protein L969DRAFT_43350 [Mixia osmundae IAM 14324]|uniref:Uncharacterized protein n=1 Tax=Mixia osmundae (strain CBS 9802 / IAM 14324 / JCM 22182 / KY 12970) TaxID=764103 RepID=G7E094_MIXOS|nr:uncharacterized protein L969DRAFT_43350 [Mixia osmundae IAM 14324]KEI42244.1 hypothetical protein L969DRAFT_43350 [Mixia osmundae IAM 14324]GAA96254.1 hypothetical protein E5Q_02918 [Mixia osmundae IAM 14324]
MMLVLVLLGLARFTVAWGVVGHEAVATIAQVFLTEEARQGIQAILPPNAQGHLAFYAAWPDRVRFAYPWSSHLHYAGPNATGEDPPMACHYDQVHFVNEDNVMAAVLNYTSRLADTSLPIYERDLALRFATHYYGDLTQPLHLIHRERGGNGDPILFEGRRMSMHGLWDSVLIARLIRTMRGYERPLPSKRIEDSLGRDSIYKPLVRKIIWQGILRDWRSLLPDWIACPTNTTTSDSATICPYHWAKQTHDLNCRYVYPSHYEHTQPLRDIATKDYLGPIEHDAVIEKQLAKGGLRLAKALNDAFRAPDDHFIRDGLANEAQLIMQT